MRRQRFRQHGLLTPKIERLHSSVRESFSFGETTLGKQRARARLVNRGGSADVLKVKAEAPGAIDVFVRLVEILNGIKQVTQVVLDTSAISLMPSLLKVITRPLVFDQGEA